MCSYAYKHLTLFKNSIKTKTKISIQKQRPSMTTKYRLACYKSYLYLSLSNRLSLFSMVSHYSHISTLTHSHAENSPQPHPLTTTTKTTMDDFREIYSLTNYLINHIQQQQKFLSFRFLQLKNNKKRSNRITYRILN